MQAWPRTTQIDRKLSVSTQRVYIASRLAGNPCFEFFCWGSLEKVNKNTIMVQNHPDRQEIVGFYLKGSYCKPFGWKPLFSACFEGATKKVKKCSHGREPARSTGNCRFLCFEGSTKKVKKCSHGREPARSTGNCRFLPKGFILQAVCMETFVLSVF